MKYSKFFKKNKLFVIVAAVVVVGALSYFFFFKGNGESTYKTYKVSYGNVIRDISETGIVRPAKTINLAFEAQGKIDKVMVKEGDKVKAGQELVSLDRDELVLQVSEAAAALQTAQANLDKVLAGASAEDIQVYETAVANAEVTLADTIEGAENDLEQVREDMIVDIHDAYVSCDDAVRNKVDQFFINPRTGSPELSFSTTDSALDVAIESGRVQMEDTLNSWLLAINSLADSSDLDAYISTAESDINNVKSFLDKVALAINSSSLAGTTYIDTWKAAVAAARTEVNTALSTVINQKQKISATKITNQTNINTAQASVDTARDNLALKKAAPRDADLNLAKAQVDQARASLALRQENLSKSVLKSPIDGVVTKVDAEIGEVAAMNAPVVSVDSRGDFEIKVNIYEEDIPWVKTGEPVDISVVAFPDEVLKGHVVSVDPAEKLVGGVVYYEVDIAFDNEKEGLKNGMTADITIMTGERDNVLIVPKSAVSQRTSTKMVEVLSGGVIEERAVETGLEGTNGNIEVLSGLSEGEDVVVQ